MLDKNVWLKLVVNVRKWDQFTQGARNQMTTIIKLPNQSEYINTDLISSFRIAEPNDQHKGYRVFIDLITGNTIRYRWVHFKTKKSAQNFCALLKKKINNAK